MILFTPPLNPLLHSPSWPEVMPGCFFVFLWSHPPAKRNGTFPVVVSVARNVDTITSRKINNLLSRICEKVTGLLSERERVCRGLAVAGLDRVWGGSWLVAGVLSGWWQARVLEIGWWCDIKLQDFRTQLFGILGFQVKITQIFHWNLTFILHVIVFCKCC